LEILLTIIHRILLPGAFRIAKPEQVSGKRLAIVEDVVTTSITVTELARVLMKAGASEIHVWSLARTCL